MDRGRLLSSKAFIGARRRLARRAFGWVSAVALVLIAVPPTQAAFPGDNGKIAFERRFPSCPAEVYSMNPDGTGEESLTHNGADDNQPAWSRDGRRIAFISDRLGPPCAGFNHPFLFTMKGDGSDVLWLAIRGRDPSWSSDGRYIAYMPTGGTEVTIAFAEGGAFREVTDTSGELRNPAWSPDGTEIAFGRRVDDPETPRPDLGLSDIWIVGVDGSGLRNLTNTADRDEIEPDWSPDGQRIAYSTPGSIRRINVDGSGDAPVSAGLTYAEEPAWSPDGTKIAFAAADTNVTDFEIYTANADGTGQTQITDNEQEEHEPSWQPLMRRSSPPPPYDAPLIASPLRVELVPHFRETRSASQCQARGGTPGSHGAPLSFASCNPPGYAPGTVAHLGPDGYGSARLTVDYGDFDGSNSDAADLVVEASLHDVQTASEDDYNPSLSGADVSLLTRFRISDTNNGPSQADPATLVDFDHSVPIACVSTVEPEFGSDCNVDTSANALTPGMVSENKSMVVQAFRTRVFDSGLDGVRGNADDRLFASQGLYVP